MIIWQGFGFLGVLLPMAFYVLSVVVVRRFMGPNYLDQHAWPGSLGILLGAIAVFLLGVKLDTPGRTLVDVQSGQSITFKPRHTFFFIPLRYIAVVLALVAAGMLLFKSNSNL